MADRFWVENTGNWSDTAHWSSTSGGAGGASVPTSADNVYFDINSFTLTGQAVTINAASSCVDMDWTGVTNNPTLAGTSSISIRGSLTLSPGMSVTKTSSFNFSASSTGKTITTAGLTLPCDLVFQGVGGGWTLQDNINQTATKSFSMYDGTINTNGKTVTTGHVFRSGTSAVTFTTGSSIFNVSLDFNLGSTTNLTYTDNTNTINMIGGSRTFKGLGLTYNIVNFIGTNITITDSNTFNILTIAAGKTLKLTSVTTQTVTSLVCNGTTASPSTLQSVTAGSPATIVLPAGRYFIRHTSIKDITIIGATSVTSIAGTNVSGNTGITFVAKFEMGRIKNDGSFNWYNSTTGTVTKVSG